MQQQCQSIQGKERVKTDISLVVSLEWSAGVGAQGDSEAQTVIYCQVLKGSTLTQGLVKVKMLDIAFSSKI